MEAKVIHGETSQGLGRSMIRNGVKVIQRSKPGSCTFSQERQSPLKKPGVRQQNGPKTGQVGNEKSKKYRIHRSKSTSS